MTVTVILMAPLQLVAGNGSWSVPNPGNLVDGDTGNTGAQSQRHQTSQHLWLRWMTC
ncbi:hypothetical protein [Acinetobacter baumannii]|uniref:hypothetical protein n=1 Tax=Acinetobacter baumannii TaxID=470 RepID=UPI003D2F5036